MNIKKETSRSRDENTLYSLLKWMEEQIRDWEECKGYTFIPHPLVRADSLERKLQTLIEKYKNVLHFVEEDQEWDSKKEIVDFLREEILGGEDE